jgi:hypothetical protein
MGETPSSSPVLPSRCPHSLSCSCLSSRHWACSCVDSAIILRHSGPDSSGSVMPASKSVPPSFHTPPLAPSPPPSSPPVEAGIRLMHSWPAAAAAAGAGAVLPYGESSQKATMIVVRTGQHPRLSTPRLSTPSLAARSLAARSLANPVPASVCCGVCCGAVCCGVPGAGATPCKRSPSKNKTLFSDGGTKTQELMEEAHSMVEAHAYNTAKV